MSLAVRILLAWSTVSLVVSPLVGKMLAAGSSEPVRVPATRALHAVRG